MAGAGKAVVGNGAGALGFSIPSVSETGLRTSLGAKTLGDDGRGGSALDLETGSDSDGVQTETIHFVMGRSGTETFSCSTLWRYSGLDMAKNPAPGATQCSDIGRSQGRSLTRSRQ
jgi:hypothetical protein